MIRDIRRTKGQFAAVLTMIVLGVGILAAAVVVGLISEVPNLRFVRRMSLAKVTKERVS